MIGVKQINQPLGNRFQFLAEIQSFNFQMD